MNFTTYAQSDLAAAQQARTRLDEVLPHCREQAKAYAEMAKDGYISRLAKENYYECFWKPWTTFSESLKVRSRKSPMHLPGIKYQVTGHCFYVCVPLADHF